MRLRLLPLAFLLGFAACTQEPSPTTFAEAQFTVNPGAGNRSFELIGLEALNASHTINMSLQAPYMFFMENAEGPVQGIFMPSTEDSVSDVELLFGGETVPRIVSEPSENSHGCPVGLPEGALCVNSCPPELSTPCVDPEPATVEVRFDVSSVPSTLYTANVGSISQDHIISTTQTPTTIYLEAPQEIAQGVFTKFDPNASLTVTLIVDGVARDTDTSPSGNTEDAIVQYQFQ